MHETTSYELYIAITTALGFSSFIVLSFISIVVIMFLHHKYYYDVQSERQHAQARLLEAKNEAKKI